MSLQTVGKQEKYGLISKKKQHSNRLVTNCSVFKGLAEEEEVDHETEIARANKQGFGKKDIIFDNIDSSIYDYDGEYDNFKIQRESELILAQRNSTNASNPTFRYIDSLKAAAKVREIEKERIFERKLLKERETEDDEFRDKPKFITSAYKEKLKEVQEWDYEDRLAQEIEARQDVKSKGMYGFYSNLLTKNISLGSDVGTNAISAYTAGSARQKKLDGEKFEDSGDKIEEKRREGQTDQRELPVLEQPRPNALIQPLKSEVAAGNDAVARASVASRDEQIASARERYLARKRSIHQIENNS